MHVYFDGDGRPFILNSQMSWPTEPKCVSGTCQRDLRKDHIVENVEKLRVSDWGLAELL